MALKSGRNWVVCGALSFVACSSSAPSSEAPGISAHIKATGTQTITTSLTLPAGLTSGGLLVAQDSVQLYSNISVPGPVWSAGSISMQPDVKVPSAIVATGNVVLADRDTVTSITYGGSLTQGNANTIGTATHAPLTNSTRSASVTFPAASLSYTLNSGQSRSLAPGSYVSVSVTANSGATLTLAAGDYYFGSLDLQSSAILKLSPAQGATRIFVSSGLTWRPTLASGTDPSRFFVEYLGTNPVFLETPFWGSIVAPRALVTIGTANSQPHRGTFTGKSVVVQPNAKLELVAFNPSGTVSSCAAGTWDPDGNPFTPCVSKSTCVPGTYVSNGGTTTSDRTCAACTSGQFSNVNNATSCTSWTSCQAGTYVSNTPSSTVDRVCVSCPTGQYSSGNNQSQCLPQGTCAAGTVQTAAGTSTSATVCTPCVAGQYCAGGTTPQTTCVAGVWDNDANPATVCVAKTDCLAGTYVTNEGTTTADRTCAACASGSFSSAINAVSCTTWTTCLAGSYVTNTPSTTVDRTCANCPAGQYSASNNQASCQPQGSCAAGTEQLASGTTTSAVVCGACLPGQYCAGGTAMPVACEADSWDNDLSPATPCVAKTSCLPGTFVAAEGTAISDRVCAACVSGSFSTVSNAAVCVPWSTCQAGTFVSNTPSATVDRSCVACAPGQYTGGENQSSCIVQGSCAAGTIQTAPGTSTSATVCEDCVAGQYCAGGTDPATVCGDGTWDSDTNPATACAAASVCAPGTHVLAEATPTTDRVCETCPLGTFSITANAASCATWVTCEAGTYVSNAPSATSDRLCSVCETGKYSAIQNAAACAAWTTCAAGSYVANTPSSTTDRLCIACEADQYTSGDNQSGCLPQGTCSAGFVQIAAGSSTSATICGPCMAGEYCAGGTAPEVACANGTWDQDQDPATVCVSKSTCAAGTFVASEGSSTSDRSCTACGDQQFSSEPNSPSCTTWATCAAGTFVSNAPSATVDRICATCGANSYSVGTNAASCTPVSVCAAGTFVSSPATVSSDAVCSDCAPGTFSATPNAEQCQACACNEGLPCTNAVCSAVGTCSYPAKPGNCAIDGACYADGDPAAGNNCQVCDVAASQATWTTKPDGALCEDGNACTQGDSCQAGACVAGPPAVCAASDQCHLPGVCDPSNGACISPAKDDGTACDDGNPCTQSDSCQAGTCAGTPVVCAAADQCHEGGSCDPSTGACTNPARADGTACNDGDACTQVDRCQSGACVGAEPVACSALDQCHSVGSCDPGTGICSNPFKANGTGCSDGDGCTQTDTCQSGICTGGVPVTCAASDQCHDAGTCDSATGQCSNPAKADGTICDDASACTRSDICQAGICTGSEAVVCTASDQCHEAGTCNASTGECSNPAKANGASCNDGNPCTQTDTCQAGSCTGGSPVVCTASDQCHDPGTCDQATGQCSNPVKADGANCSDGSACTQTDTCQGGLCRGGNPVACAAGDQCADSDCDEIADADDNCPYVHNPEQANGDLASMYSGAVGLWRFDEASGTTAKDSIGSRDGVYTDASTRTKAGRVGSAALFAGGTRRITLPTSISSAITGNNITVEAWVNSETVTDAGGHRGIVSETYPTDNVDVQFALWLGTQNKLVAGFSPQSLSFYSVTAPAALPMKTWVHVAATYDGHYLRLYQDGIQVAVSSDLNRALPRGGGNWRVGAGDSTLDPANAWVGRIDEVAIHGRTLSASEIKAHTLREPGDACDPCPGDGDPTCRPTTCTDLDGDGYGGAGASNCSGGADKIDCDDSNPDVHPGAAEQLGDGIDNDCEGTIDQAPGSCAGSGTVACSSNDQCRVFDSCNPSSGTCASTNKPDGTPCNDGNACTANDTCQSGACTGTTAPACTVGQCELTAGICDPGSGECTNTPKPDGISCNDGSACTRTDICQSGTCVGADPVVCSTSDQCHGVGTCNPSTGTCDNPLKSDGASCEDGNAVTVSDECIAGTCIPGNPSTCVKLVSIKAGKTMTCGLWSDGQLWCWGAGSSWTLGVGDGVRTPRMSPTRIQGQWTSVAVGVTPYEADDDFGTCATKADKTLWCWGIKPVQVEGSNWEQVAVGSAHRCAIKSDGTLWCWGANVNGQLGDGTTTYRASVVQVGTANDWIDVSLGHAHSCGIRADGSLWCWGLNNYGQLGDGSTTLHTTPVRIGTANDWTEIGLGYISSCGIRGNGTLWCWGGNDNGDLGDGAGSQRISPVQIGEGGWTHLSKGMSFTCGRRNGGEMWCWGHNGGGQLGLGTVSDPVYLPKRVPGEGWDLMATGQLHACATKQDASLWCWGQNGLGSVPISGQLGSGWGLIRQSLTPLQIGPAGCVETCRDGLRDWSEECDDGNAVAGDGCGLDCKRERCGDGKVQTSIGVRGLEISYLTYQSVSNWSNTEFKINGVSVGGLGSNMAPGGCNGPIERFRVTNPAFLSLIRTGTNTISFASDADIAWMKVKTWGPSIQEVVVMESRPGDAMMNRRDGCVPGRAAKSFSHEYTINLVGGEECDDGNTVSGDGCNSTCGTGVCGNGTIESGEECDDRNTTSGDGCSANCRLEFCGDGEVRGSEACDDGNTFSGDGCSATCQVEACVNVTCSACLACNPSTGACTVPKVDGTSCNADGNPCTVGDSCQAGTCVPGPANTCPPDQCHDAGTCDLGTGLCSNAKPDGTTCNDGNSCTHSDACSSGRCAGTPISPSDGDPCTIDSCDLVVGIKHVPVQGPGCVENHLPDLVPSELDSSQAAVDPITLAVAGQISIKISNQGKGPAAATSQMVVFLDHNLNRLPDDGDTILARQVLEPFAFGEVRSLVLPVSGQGFFPGNLFAVVVDADREVAEIDESNNYIDSTPACQVIRPSSFNAALRWAWGNADDRSIMMAPVVGDLDGDGVPEIVVTTFMGRASYLCTFYSDNRGTIRVLNGRTGQEKCHTGMLVGCESGIALGDIDGDGKPEIVSHDQYFQRVVAVNGDCSIKWAGPDNGATAESSSVALADLDHDGRSEIIIGATVFDSTGRRRWRGSQGIGAGKITGAANSIVADLDMDGVPEVVAGRTAYRSDGQIYWNTTLMDGYAAVANFDDDPFPEVVEIGCDGYPGALARVTMLSHDGIERWHRDFPDGGVGGPPLIADLDGDGRPEIGIAGRSKFVAYKRDGQVMWSKDTVEGSSGFTSGAAFDFDGDGKFEIVYGDQDNLFVFDGSTGNVLWSTPSRNGTWMEAPVVADVDGDGHAEIVKVLFTDGTLNGIEVYGSPTRDWMTGRKVWNQHSYHVTNVNDDLTIPTYETPSWQRGNSYRATSTIKGCGSGRADLVASYMRVSPDAAGLRVVARIGNGGQSPVLAGSSVSFYAGNPNAGGTLLGTVKTTTVLGPGGYEDLSATVPTGSSSIWVAADDLGGMHGEIAELDELNNLVRQPDNSPPAVYAGDNLTVTAPAPAVGLKGSVQDDGLPYGSTVDIVWTQVSGPGQVVFANPHAAATTASFPVLGDYQLQLQGTDGTLSATSTMTVTVVPPVVNQAPVVKLYGPSAVELPPGTANLAGLTEDDGLPAGSTLQFGWVKISGPGDVTFGSAVDAVTSVTFSALGTYVLELDVSDGALTGAEQITVAVIRHNDAPVASAGSNQTLSYPTRTTVLTGTASDDGQPAGSTLATTWTAVSGPGAVTFATPKALVTSATFDYPGTYVLRLTASDGALWSSSEVTVNVGAMDGAAPVVVLTTPVDGAKLYAPADASGQVSGGEWRLESRLGGEDSDAPWVKLAGGSGQVPWGTLGHIDTTMMLNGTYAIRLTSTTTTGQAQALALISVEKNLKVGNFTVSFNDLSVPVSGLPIEVVRTYDSRDKAVGDFGVGWNVSLRNIRVEASGILGRSWQQMKQPGFWPQYCLTQARSRFVTVTFPTGKLYRFKAVADPSCEMFTQVGMTALSFEPEAGTHGELTTEGGDSLLVADGTLFGADMQPFNPTVFQFTSTDGMTYNVETKKGLRWMQDRNGNTVNVSAAGVIHSSGKGIEFQRDASGRITKMTDPSGQSLTYAYDGAGDLHSVTDREGKVTTYAYNDRHGLLDINDPRGVRAIRNEYDSDGRLASSTDANGKTIAYTHHLDANEEVITDRTGAQRLLTYDSAGNVTHETDAEGGTITRRFDGEDNRLTETDALGNATQWEYDSVGNVTKVTDALGKTTGYTYNAWNQVLTTTDALGHVTTNTYDGNGNLLSTKDPSGTPRRTRTVVTGGKRRERRGSGTRRDTGTTLSGTW